MREPEEVTAAVAEIKNLANVLLKSDRAQIVDMVTRLTHALVEDPDGAAKEAGIDPELKAAVSCAIILFATEIVTAIGCKPLPLIQFAAFNPTPKEKVN